MKDTTAGTAVVEVPAVGGSVEVRRIPTKLLRQIHAKATKRGRLDFQELMVWKLVYGLKEPNSTESEAKEITSRHSLRTLTPILDRIDALSGTDEHLRVRMDVPKRVRWFAEQMVMASAWIERFPGPASRTPRSPRARGAGRPARRATTQTRAGPDDEPHERTCACGCDLDIRHRAPQARYLNDTHANAARQRRKRIRARDWNPDLSRRDPYLQRDPMLDWFRRRVEEGCRCNGHHIPDETGYHCVKCGHDRGPDRGGRAYIRAQSAETRRPRTPEVFV